MCACLGVDFCAPAVRITNVYDSVHVRMYVFVCVLAAELTYFSTFNIHLDFDRP